MGNPGKIEKANPMVKEVFLRGLKYRKKEELENLLQRIEVSEDGFDISTLLGKEIVLICVENVLYIWVSYRAFGQTSHYG
jgi:hypothetical protein